MRCGAEPEVYNSCLQENKHACGGVVNAANCQLLHSGGVAKHVCKAAGPGFQATCDAVRTAQPRGTVEVASCVVTSAGQLPCSKVIHTVGPNFFSGLTPYYFCTSVVTS